MTPRARFRILAALLAAGCTSDPTGGGDLLVVSQIDVQPPSVGIVLGATQQLTATPRTSSGITVPDRTVTWTTANASVATVSAGGLVTGVAVGQTNVTAHVDDVTTDVSVNVSPKPVASVTLEPPQAEILVGAAVQFEATPRDNTGQALQDRPVTFVSDDPAIATVSVTGLVLAIAPGNTTIRATSEGKTGTATVHVIPRPASRLGFLNQPPDGTAGVALGPVRVAVQNDLGETISDATTAITMSVGDNPGGGTLSGTLTVNAVAGVATFSNLLLDKAAAGYTIRASAAPLSPSLSNPFAIVAGTAAAITVTTQPSATAPSGTVLPTQPVVQLRDGSGNAVSQAGVVITAEAVGGATLGGTAAASTNASGVATFINLSLSGPAGNYTLRFTGNGLAPATSTPIALTAGIAAGLALVVAPSANAESGVPFVQQPVVELRDGNGNPVLTAGIPITASVASGGGTLAGQLVVSTNASGRAVFTNLALSGLAGGHTIAFTGAPGQVVSPTITLAAGPAAALIIVVQPPASAINNVSFSTQPVVRVVDGAGNSVALAGVVVTASVSPGSGATSGGATATTDASGIAAFTTLGIVGSVGTYRVTFGAPGLAAAESGDVVLAPGAAARLIIVTQPSGASSGVPLTLQPRVQLADVSNNPVSGAGVVVTASLLSGPGTLGGTLTATTNGAGLATFTDLTITGGSGTYVLTFSAAGLTSINSANVGLGAGTSTQLSITTQPSSSAASGAVFAQQPAIQLQDASNNPVAAAGVVVTATIASGGGTLLGTVNATTDATGKATFTNLAISGLVGNRTIQFTSGALTPVTSSAIAITAGAPTTLVLTAQPSPTASSGVAFAQQPVVQLQDAAGNNITGLPSFMVTAAIASGSGATLGGTLVVATDANGTATFTNLALTGSNGNFTLSFSGGGYTAAVSNTIGLGAGGASILAITTQPSSSVKNGVDFPQQPVIQLQDGAFNPVAQAGVVVTVTVLTGNPVLSGTLTATTNASGTATFTDLRLTGLVGNRTLSFAATGLTSVSSGTITVTPGDPAALSITTQPAASAQNGVALSPQPSIQLLDQSGNLVSQAGVNVTAAIATGGGTLTGTTTIATNGSGVAAFTDLVISGLVGVRTLGFTSPSLTGATSNNISVTLGPPSKLAITTQPSAAARNDQVFTTQPVTQVQDAGGNPVPDAGLVVTAAIASGGGVLATTLTATTDGSGVATFTDLKITGLAGAHTIQFTAPSRTPVTSGPVTLSAGTATQIVMFTQPPASTANGATLVPNPVVDLADVSGNDVDSAGVSIAVSLASGAGVLSGTTTRITAGNGMATFNDLKITGVTGDRTLQFTNAGLATATSGTVTVTAGAPVNPMTITTQPSAAATNDVALAQQPVVHVVDGSGNPVPGVLVSVVLTGGGNFSAGSTSATTDASGDATFSGLAIRGQVGTKNLVFSASGLTNVTSDNITLAAGAATQLGITSQPGNGINGTTGSAVAPSPVVELRDSGGNLVSSSGVNVTVTLVYQSGGTGTFTLGTFTQATSSGVAVFGDLVITLDAPPAVGTFHLQFSASGLLSASSAQFTISP